MSDYELPVTVSSVRHEFGTFFDRVRLLYNLAFFKEEKDHKVDDVKRFTVELYEAGRISDYIKTVVDESIANFALLLPGQIEMGAAILGYLDASISLAISDINAEIGELIH